MKKERWKKLAINGNRRSLMAMVGMSGEWYRWGDLKVCVADPEVEGGAHISVSHPYRYPTWEEIKAAWYDLVPNASEITGAIILPRKPEYVNIHTNCFHVYQLNQSEMPESVRLKGEMKNSNVKS